MYDKPNTDAFKRTRIRFNDAADADRIQRAAHTLGFRWHYQRRYRKREVVGLTGKGFIYINHNCEMSWSRTNLAHWEERTLDNIENTAAEFKLWRKDVSKASKKRAASRKWELTTLPNPGSIPVGEDVVVSIRQKDGRTDSGKAGDFYWDFRGTPLDIERYKVLRPNYHRPPGKQKPEETKIVSLEAMVEGVAWDLGKGVAIPVHDYEATAATYPGAAPVGDVNSDARGSGARFNAGKPDYALIPMTLLEGEARVWAYGAKKYAAWNWMKGMDWSVPFACAMRHMAAWQRGEDTDPETGENHLDHAMCNLRMLRYYADFYKEGDNRPKQFFNLGSA